MGSRLGHANRGFLVPHVLFKASTLDFATPATIGTNVTEFGVRAPGTLVPSDPKALTRLSASGEWAFYLSATETSAIVKILQAGNPNLGADAARFGFYLGWETATAVRGWEPANVLRGDVAPVEWTATAGVDYRTPSLAVRRRTGDVTCAYVREDAGNETVYVRRQINPYWSTWQAATAVVTSTGTFPVAGVCELPWNERQVLVMASTNYPNGLLYYSDDYGATWTLGSTAPLMSAPTLSAFSASRLVALPTGDVVWLLVAALSTGAAVRVETYHSPGLGTSFRQTMSNNTSWSSADIAVTPGGKLLFVGITASDDLPRFYLLSTPYQSPATAGTGTALTAVTCDEVWCSVDYDGRIWVFARRRANSARWAAINDTNSIMAWTSADDGATWQVCTSGLTCFGDAAVYPSRGALAHREGEAMFVSGFVSNSAPASDGSLYAMRLGGWAAAAVGYDVGGLTTQDLDALRISFYPVNSYVATNLGLTYIPFDLVANLLVATGGPWLACTAAGPAPYWAGGWPGGGTESITTAGSGGCNRLSCAAGQTIGWYITGTAGTDNAAVVEIHISGAITGASRDVCRIVLANVGGVAGSDYDIAVRLSSTGVDCWNYATGARITGLGAEVAWLPGTAGRTLRVFVTATSAAARVLVATSSTVGSSRSQAFTQVSEIIEGAAVAAALTAVTTVAWGTLMAAANASVVDIRALNVWLGQVPAGRLYGAATSGDALSMRPIGKASVGRPYPIGHDGTGASIYIGTAWIAQTSGPSYADEIHTAAPEYDYPVEAVCWDVSPSPSSEWRSTSDGTAGRITWSPDSARLTSFDTPIVALYLDKLTTRYVKLQGKTGAGAWTDIGTFDAAIGTALAGTLTGNTLQKAAGTGAITRYLYRNELSGGTAVIVGATTAYVRIRSNTEGTWRDDDSRTCRITLDRSTYTGTIPADGAVTVAIWSPRGVLLVPAYSTAWERYCLQFDAQDTYADSFRCGIALLGSYQPVGQTWSRGWQKESNPNVESFRDDSGSYSQRKKGPIQRTLRLSWSEGVDASPIQGQGATPAPSWYSTAAGQPGAVNQGDVSYLMQGLLDTCESGAAPVVVLFDVPAAGGSITDPSLFFYGYFSGPIAMEHILGDEGDSEVARVMTIAIEGVS